MIPQSTEITSLPHLTSRERKHLWSRLELGLMKLEGLASTTIDPPEVEPNSPNEKPAHHWRFPTGQEDKPAIQNEFPSDRRAFPRRAGHCRVVVCQWSDDKNDKTLQHLQWQLHSSPLRGELANLSLNGAAFILPHKIPKGETIVVRLSCPMRDAVLEQHATIVETLDETSGQFRVMCQYTNRLSVDQLAYFSRFLDNPRWI